MRKQAPVLAVLLAVTSANAYAVSRFSQAWHYRCVSFLKTALLQTRVDLTEAEIKLDFNRQALRNGQARISSLGQSFIREIPLGNGRFAWLDNITRSSIEWLLDNNLPFWRHDGDWYFQTAHVIQLYSPRSEKPIRFEAESFILMSGESALGKIKLGSNATIDLYE